ncbi:MAG: 4a-hydroxytetrahydrobiopterin dehydratase [Streptosporangiaceae bacterium]
MELLDDAAIEGGVAKLRGWARSGDAIVKVYEHKDFREAIGFVDKVADAAEEAGHHPDIDIRWNKVTMSFTTHAAGGLTKNDFAMAGKVEEIAKG